MTENMFWLRFWAIICFTIVAIVWIVTNYYSKERDAMIASGHHLEAVPGSLNKIWKK